MGAVALVQLAIGGYRTSFIEDIRAHFGDQICIAAGNEHLDESVRTAIPADQIDVQLRNVFLFGRRLVYQRGYRRALRGRQVWVLELNPRILNTWLALIEARLSGRTTVVWGHYFGRRVGETSPRLGRRLMVRCSLKVLAYTNHDAARFAKHFPKKGVFTAPNSIDRLADLPWPGDLIRTDFVYVGRLEAAKNPEALLQGFSYARTHGLLPSVARLVLVGDGVERGALEAQVALLRLGTSVLLPGGTFSTENLNRYYAHAVAGVCGGYVGLNMTQALSRGVPFIYPLIANHSPEVTLSRPLENSFPFTDSTPKGIAMSMSSAWDASAAGSVDHVAIAASARMQYSVEKMVEGFINAVAK